MDALEKEGERLHQEHLQRLERATPEELARANEICQQHLSEYGYSFVECLRQVMES